MILSSVNCFISVIKQILNIFQQERPLKVILRRMLPTHFNMLVTRTVMHLAKWRSTFSFTKLDSHSESGIQVYTCRE
jgi:hypothetical protein